MDRQELAPMVPRLSEVRKTKVKLKVIPQQAEVAQGVPGRLGPGFS